MSLWRAGYYQGVKLLGHALCYGLRTISRQDAVFAAEKLADMVRAALRTARGFDWKSLIPDWHDFVPQLPRYP